MSANQEMNHLKNFKFSTRADQKMNNGPETTDDP